MRWFILLVLLAILALLLLAVPLFAAQITPVLGKADQLYALLRIYLMTCAFVGALWAIYLKDSRLRANSDNVLVALVVFVTASLFITAAILFSQFGINGQAAGAGIEGVQPSSAPARFIAFISLELYLIAFVTLLLTVFLQSYNQIYNLRTNKFVKYFKPIRWFRKTFGPHKRYEYTMQPRNLERHNFPLAEYFATDEDLQRLKSGASILVSGQLTERVIGRLLDWMLERMRNGETANFVAADRHPIEIWKVLESKGFDDSFRDDFVLIDCYSPSFAFTDDIHEESDRRLNDKGVSLVKAKTFAGLHTANNKAFNIIKRHEQSKKKNIRRPMVMIYAHVSALCEFESIEQFRVFWRHVIPSERSYGMLTFILEDALAGDEILISLRRVVDFELVVTSGADGEIIFKREK